MSFYSDFAEHYEAIFPFREPVYDFLRQRIGRAGGRILDIGCGTGHYCGRLAADGYAATGIDLDPKMIQVARDRYPGATFQQLDMRDIGRLSETFAAAFCIGNTLAHLPRADYPAFLGSLAGLLAPGARWIFQVMNWDYILDRGGYSFKPRGLGAEVVFERAYEDLSEARVRFGTRLLSQGREVFQGETWLYPVRAQAYRRLHEAAGFAQREHLGDFDGRPFTPAADSASLFVFEKHGEAAP
jgi:SAM-dependent methyltransferase